MMERMKKHSKKDTYFEGAQDKDFNISSMQKYVLQKPELDKRLESMIAPYLQGEPLDIVDACCGIGHLIHGLHAAFPQHRYLGFDETPYLIDEAQKLCDGIEHVRFDVDDLFALPHSFEKAFDIAISWKTLSWLPDHEEALRALMKLARSHIFVSSLFYEGDIDFEIKVKEYQKERGASGASTYYNIYSLPRFERTARALSAQKIEVVNFDIGIDLPRGNVDVMGTYTVPLKDGRRMQMSGALPMPWKIIHIEL